MFIKKINISNYKSIKNISVDDCKIFNIIFGKNNTGKTNILESIAIISSPTYPENIVKTNGQRGISNINKDFWKLFFNKLEINNIIKFEWELFIPKEKRTLEVSIRKDPIKVPNQPLLYEETINGLNYKFNKIDEKNQKTELNSSVFMNKGKIEFINQEDNVNIQTAYLELYGYITKNVVLKFDSLVKNRNLEYLIKIMKQIEPNLNNIVLSSDGYIYLDLGLENYVPINIMSKSFISIFSIACIVIGSPTSLILIDAIDNSFSSNYLDIVSNIILKFSKKYYSQVFITCSSNEFVKNFSSNMSKNFPNLDELRIHKIDNNKCNSFDIKKLDLALK